MRAHIVEGGIVTNTIEVDSLDFMPGLIDGSVGSIGDTWDGTSITPRQPTQRELEAAQEAADALVLADLVKIDLSSIRALRELHLGQNTVEAKQVLSQLNSNAAAARAKLNR